MILLAAVVTLLSVLAYHLFWQGDVSSDSSLWSVFVWLLVTVFGIVTYYASH